MSIFGILVFMVKSSVLEIEVGQTSTQTANPLLCLPQTLPINPMQKGSASIKVMSNYYYDLFLRKTVCCVLDVNVEITGATPGDYFEVFANYVILYPTGGTGQVAEWERIGSGIVDANGNLLITTFVANPTVDDSVVVNIGVADSSCENVYITQLPQMLCTRNECFHLNTTSF
jgi:hypothetical protein